MKNIKDLLSRLGLLCRLEAAMVNEIEALNNRVYALEENRKLKDAAILEIKKDLGEVKMSMRHNVML